jgi:hypothetical protein
MYPEIPLILSRIGRSPPLIVQGLKEVAVRLFREKPSPPESIRVLFEYWNRFTGIHGPT